MVFQRAGSLRKYDRMTQCVANHPLNKLLLTIFAGQIQDFWKGGGG